MKYYSTERPVTPGSFPKEGAGEIHNFDQKKFVEDIGCEAWGYIEYQEPLDEKVAEDYELIQEGMKLWYCVTTSFDDKGKVTSGITNTCRTKIQPLGTFKRTKHKDIYNDWYGSETEANEAVNEALKS